MSEKLRAPSVRSDENILPRQLLQLDPAGGGIEGLNRDAGFELAQFALSWHGNFE
ncbi:MAG: hypothetical protein WCJ64_19120 [Rhodospirillaceae bacterium]